MANPAFLSALDELVRKLEAPLSGIKHPVRMFVAGGTAVHYYTAYRVSDDVDATFSHRMMLPEDTVVVWADPQTGTPRTLYLDRQYNDSFALLHEDYQDDAVECAELNRPDRKIAVYFLSPLDLAVSKLSRFELVDQADIKQLAAHGLIHSTEVRDRAEQALGGYVGNIDRVKNSITLACKLIDLSRS